MRPIDQQTILVTGTTSGLGLELSRQLARRGATMLLHTRDRRRGEAALTDVRSTTGNTRLGPYAADLASCANVERLAREVTGDRPRLDALVNNAGIGAFTRTDGSRALSPDGVELRFAVNYLAPYVLTRRLAPLLVRSGPGSRIVNVASSGQAPIDFDNVMLERGYEGFRAYSQSKLALVMLTFDLADALRDAGVTANCLHPATVKPTKMVLDAGVAPQSSLATGVDATLRLVADAALEGVTGHYFVGRVPSTAHRQAYDRHARDQLRRLSDRLVDARPWKHHAVA